MNRSEQENLVLLRHLNGHLTWEVVWVDFIEDAIPYLERESDFDGEKQEALLIIESGSIIDGPDEYDKYLWPI